MSEDNPRAGWFDAIPGNWMWATFPDVLNDATDSKRKLPTNQYRRSGTYPVIDQGEDYISGFTDDTDLVSVAKIPCIVWGDHTRRAKFLDVRFAQGADGVKVLEPTDAVDPSFIFKAVAFAELPNKGYSRHFKFLRAKEFPLPPLEEQRRIVRKLDTLSARSATARAHLTAIEKLVARYKVAVLRGAFFVDPTGSLDEDAAIEAGWEVRPLGQTLENHDSRRIPVKAEDRKQRRGAFDYYGASGVIDKIDDFLFDGRYLLIGEDGANLLARSSPIAFVAEGQFWVNNHAHVLGETDEADLDWVKLYFAAIKLEPFVTGSAQPKLTQNNMNRIPVPLPSVGQQRAIVGRIEAAFAKIDRLAAEAEKALKLTDRLDQRILAKAFAGELVPQDPNDEPASVLLERLRAERGAKPKVRRGRRTSAVV